MGNWTIHIEGIGSHHNGKEYDVDSIFQKFVEELKKQEQFVEHASITYGSRDTISE